MGRNLRESSATRVFIAALAGLVFAAGIAAVPTVSAAASAEHHPPRKAFAEGAGPSRAELIMLERRARALRQAQAPGSITGRVLTPDGLPLTTACVTALGARGSVTTTATPSGKFVLSGLMPGSYELEYRDCTVPGRYLQAVRHVQVAARQIRAVPAMIMRLAGPAALLNHASWRQLLATASAANRSAR